VQDKDITSQKKEPGTHLMPMGKAVTLFYLERKMMGEEKD